MLYFKSYKDRRSNVAPSHTSTLDWIWEHPQYLLWESGRYSSLLWLQGKPGSGKSTLANYVRARTLDRSDLQVHRQSIVVDFFYSARGGNLQYGHYWMLRSILYQCLLKAPGLWPCYVHDFRDIRHEKHWPMDRLISVFSSLGHIHAPGLRITAYVIIDALDEAEEVKREEIIRSFRDAGSRDSSWPIAFKVFLTSRPNPKIERILSTSRTIIMEDETKKDIEECVRSETACIASEILDCRVEELDFVSDYLIEKAQGVFLWVRLVLIELDDAATSGFCSVRELEDLLAQIPTDLKQLYARIVKSILEERQSAVQECQTIFRWSAFSPRPLMVYEMLEVVAASSCPGDRLLSDDLEKRRVGNDEHMRRRIITLCRNLIEIKGGIVQFIHTSVREYLTAMTLFDDMSLNQEDSLFEIACLFVKYVEYFQSQLHDVLLPSSETSATVDVDRIIALINQCSLLRYISACEMNFICLLDDQSRARGAAKSVTDAMASVGTTLRPAVLQSMLQGDESRLDQLILFPNQVNITYAIPSGVSSDLLLSNSQRPEGSPGHAEATLYQILLSSEQRSTLDLLHLLHRRGANPNSKDRFNQTALHTAVELAGKLGAVIWKLIEEQSKPYVHDFARDTQQTFFEEFKNVGLFQVTPGRSPPASLYQFASESANPYLRGLANEYCHLCMLSCIALKGSKGRYPTDPTISLTPSYSSSQQPLWSIQWAIRSVYAKLCRAIWNRLSNSLIASDEILLFCTQNGDGRMTTALQRFLDCSDCISTLLQFGSDPIVEYSVEDQHTPLELCLHYSNDNIADMLLEKMTSRLEDVLATISTQSERQRFLEPYMSMLSKQLYKSCEEGSSDFLTGWLLHRHRSDRYFILGPNGPYASCNLLPDMYRDRNGRTAFHIALMKGRIKVASQILRFGCDWRLHDADGITALDLATSEVQEGLIKRLEHFEDERIYSRAYMENVLDEWN